MRSINGKVTSIITEDTAPEIKPKVRTFSSWTSLAPELETHSRVSQPGA